MCEPRKPAPPLIRQVAIAARGYRRGGHRRGSRGWCGVDADRRSGRSQPPLNSCCGAWPDPAARRAAPLALRGGRGRRTPARVADPPRRRLRRRPGPADRLDGRRDQARGDGGPPRPRASLPASLRRRAIDPLDCDRLRPPGPVERAERRERLAEARAALAALKANERLAIVLQAQGYSYAEICELCGWTYTKVNRCLAEGRRAAQDAARQRIRSAVSPPAPSRATSRLRRRRGRCGSGRRDRAAPAARRASPRPTPRPRPACACQAESRSETRSTNASMTLPGTG